ncbi:mannonate dehydratase [Oceaniglobus trochenteri]|uniref:mannonate dehydratase n=1 Tax=Oceaniglobus trochenteri TaxID=2763260 RepID=UPI001CFFAA64|nr:mannonate dehydratase [Oceaniglobus trochenteri]
MKQTWRWFGPADTVSTAEMRQVGVQGVVSALHQFKPGVLWPAEEIAARQKLIATLPDGGASGLTWDVVESLPVSEAIKTKAEGFRDHIATYIESMENLAAAGIEVICYNFMPVLDWTRTVLRAPMPHGGTAMLFDLVDFAAFDLFILERATAFDDYPEDCIEAARERIAAMDDGARLALQNNIVAGLPGANDTWTIEDIRGHLGRYRDIDAETLRRNLVDFLAEVVPTAERLGLRLCCHPDDPPFSIMGLPRIMSSLADYRAVMDAVESPANGATLCTGSLGVDPDFDAEAFVKALGPKIHFVHLRNTKRIAPAHGGRSSFFEAAHLEGDTDMVATLRALLAEEERRRGEGRADWQIPFRPDHGQDLLSDLAVQGMPGYPLIGRMRGLAELRGVIAGLGGAV